MVVDYAGATIPIHDRHTGQVHPAAVFVAALGFRSYTFAEAACSQQLPCWIGSHIRAFESGASNGGDCLRAKVGIS